MKCVTFGVSEHFLENPLRKWLGILNADVSWASSEMEDYGHSLLSFLILALFWLREMGQIWDGACSGKHGPVYVIMWSIAWSQMTWRRREHITHGKDLVLTEYCGLSTRRVTWGSSSNFTGQSPVCSTASSGWDWEIIKTYHSPRTPNNGVFITTFSITLD